MAFSHIFKYSLLKMRMLLIRLCDPPVNASKDDFIFCEMKFLQCISHDFVKDCRMSVTDTCALACAQFMFAAFILVAQAHLGLNTKNINPWFPITLVLNVLCWVAWCTSTWGTEAHLPEALRSHWTGARFICELGAGVFFDMGQSSTAVYIFCSVPWGSLKPALGDSASLAIPNGSGLVCREVCWLQQETSPCLISSHAAKVPLHDNCAHISFDLGMVYNSIWQAICSRSNTEFHFTMHGTTVAWRSFNYLWNCSECAAAWKT